MKKVIPVMHCFDKNYVIPAAVSFFSMLLHADKNYHYALYVVHNDISIEMQEKLIMTVSAFDNCSLDFLYAGELFADTFDMLPNKAHYSKEMFFKLIAPEIFNQYDRLILTDVDVVFLGDISKDFIAGNSNDYYVEGCKGLVRKGSWVDNYLNNYNHNFSADEKKMCSTIGAGYMIFNLTLMRQDGLANKFLKCVNENLKRLIQPEQDVINIVCDQRIKILPASSMVCSYSYPMYTGLNYVDEDVYFNSEDVIFALQHPVQLHYAGRMKPWIKPSIPAASHWYKHLLETPFGEAFLSTMRIDSKQ